MFKRLPAATGLARHSPPKDIRRLPAYPGMLHRPIFIPRLWVPMVQLLFDGAAPFPGIGTASRQLGLPPYLGRHAGIPVETFSGEARELSSNTQ